MYLTDRRRDDFLHYLEALEAVLREAAATSKAGRRLLTRFGRAALDAT